MKAKFRIWDIQEKKMAFEGFHLFGEVTLFEVIDDYLFQTRGDKTTLERYNDLVEMQWTTLQDKNGKDVYVGDILKKYTGTLYTVIFRDAKFMGLSHKEDDYGPFTMALGKNAEDKSFEVVGNIHANPELIHPS